MKIEKISFDNINSLGGHFEVDWQHPSLTDAGIFVITGPTGVGKTSLLDAICYAIYGCTARQPKLSASNNEIMTHGARFCRAEAWVEKDGQRYLFTCEQRRKKTRVAGADPYTTPTRSVSRIGADGSATLLANKVREVEGIAESLMKFSNFTRCMMLAQGEFARFLKDSAAGRSEALATITGTEVYQRIGDKVQERVAALRAQIQQVALHEVLPEEERHALGMQLGEAERGQQAGKAALDALDNKLAWLAELAKAGAARTACEAELQRARENAAAFEQAGQVARIRAAEAAWQLRPLEQAAAAARDAVQQQSQQHAREQEWLAAHPGTTEKEQAGKAAAELATQEPDIDLRLRFLAEQVQPREESIARAAVAAQNAAQEAARRQRLAGKAQDALAQAETALQAAAREQDAAESLRRQLRPDAVLVESLPAIRQRFDDWAACPQAAAPLPEDAELAAREAAWQQEQAAVLGGRRRDELPQRLAQLEGLQAAGARHARAQQQFDRAVQAEESACATLAALPSVDEAQRALDKAQQREQLAFRIQEAGQQLDELYREFCAGKLPCCPCCGSPVPHARPVQADSVLSEAREQVSRAQTELLRRQKQHEDARAARAAAQADFGAAQKAVAEAAQELAAALATLGWAGVPDDLDAQTETLRRNMEALADLDRRRAALDTLARLADCRRALHQSLVGSTPEQPASLSEARALVRLLDSRLRAWKTVDERAAKASNACDLATATLGLARRSLDEKLGERDAAQAFAKDNAEALTRLRDELAALWQGGPAREAEQSARRRLAALQKAVTATRDAWQEWRREQEAHLALAKAAEERLPALYKVLEQAERDFAEALQEQNFADREACAAARLDARVLDELRARQQALGQAVATAEGACRQAAAQEQVQRALALTDESAEALTAQRAEQAEAHRQKGELVNELRSRLRADELNRAANAEKEAQIADVRAELERWRRLYDILGNSRDGFKKYAQRITFNLLLVQANAQLRRLSDRYVLLQDPQEELGLLVLDRYQDKPRGRACSNLSGGESFIVSLALALGLSRMAGETRIDTLFLDEGFGTLDEDALEHVLDCLQGLRAGGKLIGIISHVAALKERIPANIELRPLGASGLSTLVEHDAVVAQPGL